MHAMRRRCMRCRVLSTERVLAGRNRHLWYWRRREMASCWFCRIAADHSSKSDEADPTQACWYGPRNYHVGLELIEGARVYLGSTGRRRTPRSLAALQCLLRQKAWRAGTLRGDCTRFWHEPPHLLARLLPPACGGAALTRRVYGHAARLCTLLESCGQKAQHMENWVGGKRAPEQRGVCAATASACRGWARDSPKRLSRLPVDNRRSASFHSQST